MHLGVECQCIPSKKKEVIVCYQFLYRLKYVFNFYKYRKVQNPSLQNFGYVFRSCLLLCLNEYTCLEYKSVRSRTQCSNFQLLFRFWLLFFRLYSHLGWMSQLEMLALEYQIQKLLLQNMCFLFHLLLCRREQKGIILITCTFQILSMFIGGIFGHTFQVVSISLLFCLLAPPAYLHNLG